MSRVEMKRFVCIVLWSASIRKLPACLAGVKTGRIHLRQMAGITV